MNPEAQDLATAALQQYDALLGGVLQEQVVNPTDYYPSKPWIDEPEGSISFDPQNGLALDVVGAPTQIVLRLIVPIGMDGVIKQMSNNTTFPFEDFSGSLQWQLLRNGTAIRNYDNIRNQKGTLAHAREISPIRIYSGDVIDYVVNHLADATLNGNIVCSLSGYYYPIQGNA